MAERTKSPLRQATKGGRGHATKNSPSATDAMKALAGMFASAGRGSVAATGGIAGDIESLARMLIGNENPTMLPTTKDVSRALPQLPEALRVPQYEALGEFAPLTPSAISKLAKPVGKLSAEAIARGVEGQGPLSQVLAAAAPMNVVKQKGGNWLSGSVEDALSGLKKEVPEWLRPGVNSNTAARDFTKEDAINSWIDKNLGNYVRNQMATPEDPIRALAEKGVLHIGPEQLTPRMGNLQDYPHRQTLGKELAARQWENAADSQILTDTAKYFQQPAAAKIAEKNPWLAKVEPDVDVHQMARTSPTRDLGFDHLIDELSNALNPASGLPTHLQFPADRLAKVSVPQAVERVSQINAWRAAQMEAARKAAREGIPVHKEHEGGFKWMKAPDTAKDPKGLQYIKDVGCESGWCTQSEQLAKQYGGNGNELYVLHDPEGKSVVQIAVDPGKKLTETDLPDSVRDQLADFEGSQQDFEKLVQQSLAQHEIHPRIKEIKGRQNRKPDDKYLPFVQDFVRSGKWSDVGDLQNTGLIRAADQDAMVRAALTGKPIGIDEGYAAAKRIGERQPYFTQDELLEAFKSEFPDNFAHGGTVKPRVTPDQFDVIIAALTEGTPTNA